MIIYCRSPKRNNETEEARTKSSRSISCKYEIVSCITDATSFISIFRAFFNETRRGRPRGSGKLQRLATTGKF